MTQNTAHQIIENPAEPAALASHGAAPLTGRFVTPGDAAISHGALLLGALAVGRTQITGLLEGDAVLATAAALRQLGVGIAQRDGVWLVDGLGVGGLLAPEAPLDLGAAGAGAPLLLGLLAPYGFSSQLGDGALDPALTELLEALAPLGVALEGGGATGQPLAQRGAAVPLPVHLAAPAAATKAALLLAGAQLAGVTTLIELLPTHDHVEKLLAGFGAALTMTADAIGVTTISITGLTPLTPCAVAVPGDPALAAYPLLAGLLVPGSDLVVENVLINPSRTGLIDTLLEMGGDIQFLNQHESGGEHVADLRVRSSRLKAVQVSAEHAAAMLDDIALLAIAAAYAQGETVIEGLAAWRGPDDRLAAIVSGLVANQVTASASAGRLTIVGSGAVEGGGMVAVVGDPGLAKSFLLLGLASRQAVTIDDSSAADAAFPGFVAAMTAIGARFEASTGAFL